MIIDAHVTVDPHNNPAGEVMRALQSVDTESAFIFADPDSVDLSGDNAYVLRSARDLDCHPFYYLGGNPFTDSRMDLEVPDNLADYAGVRWHHWFGESRDTVGRLDRHELEFAVTIMESPEFEALMSALAHYRLPIIFEEDFGVTLELVARFHNLAIIIPHMGAFSGGEELIVGRLYRADNVYFTTSHSRLDPTLARRIGPERILYGSDFPYGSPRERLARIEHLGLGEAELDLILGENAQRLLEMRYQADVV